MIMDHLVVGSTDLASARAHVEDALGVAMQPGGAHPVFQTHNTVMALEDGLYLEAIAPNPGVPAPTRPRWFNLDQFQGPARLSNWVCAVTDMESVLPTMPAGIGSPVALQRGALSWSMAVAADGTTPFDCLWPAIIAWSSGPHPSKSLPQVGVRLRRLTLCHPEGDALSAALAHHLVDDRIAVETDAIALHARFDTPHGERSL